MVYSHSSMQVLGQLFSHLSLNINDSGMPDYSHLLAHTGSLQFFE